MTHVGLVEETEALAEVKAIYDEIKKTLGISFVPDAFKAMGRDPKTLRAAWTRFTTVMSPGELSRREKELVALAVSLRTDFKCCVYGHTVVLRRLGVSEKAVLELIAVVRLFKDLGGLPVEPEPCAEAAGTEPG